MAEEVMFLLSGKNPLTIKEKYVKIKYIAVAQYQRTLFRLFCNLPKWVKEPYRRFVEADA